MSDTVPKRSIPILAARSTGLGYSWKAMMRATPAERFSLASRVRITGLKLTRKSGVLTKITGKSTSRTDVYETVIELPSPEDHDRTKVSCNCSDFVFRWEFALYRKGGADIHYGDGTPPDKTNPSMSPGVCKHILALRTLAEEKGLL